MKRIGLSIIILGLFQNSWADENLFGYVKGAETLPKGGQELYQWVTNRSDKGAGHYSAFDYKTEYERGITDKFNASVALKAMSLDTSGIVIDGYMPEDKKFAFKISGVELGGKYNFLSPASETVGLSNQFELSYTTIDPHSGQDKDTLSFENNLILQKYFMDASLVWVGNLMFEGTYAKRSPINNLPENFEWPTKPEMELELQLGTGLSYRFAPNWYAGAETQYETEFETEVGQERWSWFMGPSLHYGSKDYWLTATWFPQLRGGREKFDEQDDRDLHLIEKTKNEFRLKFGYNF
ncbi:hypothetical protein RFI02_04385 [Acinetobacter sichuanensis]|uniref:DUF6662 family protein n=1 Tax=Acinetobacter sichuanensis TaxID=2136183 RepID=UPI0028106739|nr:DUF6662 family protein [Acinetobacter sichuanensis]MDQ9020340.1 hypothetical protein [Acinetobacter sichuanensis]